MLRKAEKHRTNEPVKPRAAMTRSDLQLAEWLQAAGFKPDDDAMRSPVEKAGQFLQNNGDLKPNQIAKCLSEIDFRQGLVVVRLPNSVLVRDESPESDSLWFSDTGLAADFVKPIASRARRPLFAPMGPIPALRAAALAGRGVLAADQVFQGISPRLRADINNSIPRAGGHYIVPGSSRLRLVR